MPISANSSYLPLIFPTIESSRIMTIWKNCDMEVYPAEYEYGEVKCIVKIEDSKIRVEYRDGTALLVYEGKEQGAGHFRLTATTHDGRGTLHLFPNDLPDDAILEGWYYEEKQRGMWRIHLSD